MQRFRDKVVIVTGASKGIGAAIARGFAAEGARVVVNYASAREDAERVVADIVARDGKAVAVQADVGREADVKRLFAETRQAFGRLDVLVNNAAVFDFQPLEQVTGREFHRQFDVNVLGLILTTQEALDHFGPDGGSVINVSSVASVNPPPNSVIYAATKGAVDTITLALAKELAPRGIRVNTLAPGAVDTEGARRLGFIGSDFQKQVVNDTPLKRIGTPDDIATVALFLASPASAWLTGERITASGGYR